MYPLVCFQIVHEHWESNQTFHVLKTIKYFVKTNRTLQKASEYSGSTCAGWVPSIVGPGNTHSSSQRSMRQTYTSENYFSYETMWALTMCPVPLPLQLPSKLDPISLDIEVLSCVMDTYLKKEQIPKRL